MTKMFLRQLSRTTKNNKKENKKQNHEFSSPEPDQCEQRVDDEPVMTAENTEITK